MALFASVALIRRNNGIVFLPTRKEPSNTATQARKSASRFWAGRATGGDVLTKVILVHTVGPLTVVHERDVGRDRPWVEYHRPHAEAAKQAHIAACLAELDVDPAEGPPPMPETLEINGVIYRREI